MKITIGVGGRFTADRMANALATGGNSVNLVTSLPRSRFKGANYRIRSHVIPELIYQFGKRFGSEEQADLRKMLVFGNRLAGDVSKAKPDVFIGWSSFSLETFKLQEGFRRILVRESNHIDVQYEILRNEYRALGLAFPEQKGRVDRERQEYEMADGILVCSRLIEKSFLDKGVPKEKIHRVSLGVDTELFRSKPKEAMRPPYKIVYFGALSVRKGVHHLLEATSKFSREQFTVSLIGPIENGYEQVLKKYPHARRFRPMPQETLAKVLPHYDLFVFPTLEDGFGTVVPQAMASGLIPIVSDRSGAAEIIENGKNGFVVKGGSVHELGTLLKSLLERVGEMPKFRQAALESVAKLDWEGYNDQMLEILNRVAPGSKSGA